MEKKKELRIHALIGTLALALPGLALSGEPDPALLGDVGAIGAFCSRLEGQGGDDALVRELSRQFGAEATGSAEFREAYAQMSDALGKLGRSRGLALCGSGPGAAPGGHESGHGGGR